MVARVARLLGYDPFPWQEHVWDVALEVQSEEAGDPNPGFWAYDTVDFTGPRRAGKSTLVQPVAMHRAESIPRCRIFMTAQDGLAAGRRWGDLADTIEDSYMGDRVRKRDSPGHQRLTWVKSRAVLEPFSPKRDSAHGDEPDLVLVDEVWTYDAVQGAKLDNAVRPTFLTNNAQMWRYSTAGTTASAYYNAMRRQGRKAVKEGRTLGRFYLEFSIPEEVDGVAVEDLPDDALIDLIVEHHPRTDLNMRAFLVDELAAAQEEGGEGREGFIRAYGNHVTVDVGRQAIVSPAILSRGLTTEGIPQDPTIGVGLAVDVDPDGRQASIAAAWRRGDAGHAITSVIRCDAGTRWAAAEVIGIHERQLNRIPQVVINDTAYTRDLADKLEAAGVDVLRLNLKDYAAACGRWFDETTAVDAKKHPAPTVFHRGHPALLTAIADVKRAKVGTDGGWKFAVRLEPITALTATALALWGFDHLPEPEETLGPFRIR